MKRFLFSLILSVLSLGPTCLLAQTNSEPQTLFESGSPINTEDLGLFLAPSFGFTQMDGDAATLFNLRGGVTIKEKLAFGAYFNTSLGEINPQSEVVPNVYMDYWSVGGFAEYTWNASKLVHLTFPVYFGWGEVQMDNEAGNANLGEANFFQVEPSALLEVNLHKFVRFNLGAGYRVVGNMNYRNFNQSDISGLTGYVGLKFNIL